MGNSLGREHYYDPETTSTDPRLFSKGRGWRDVTDVYHLDETDDDDISPHVPVHKPIDLYDFCYDLGVCYMIGYVISVATTFSRGYRAWGVAGRTTQPRMFSSASRRAQVLERAHGLHRVAARERSERGFSGGRLWARKLRQVPREMDFRFAQMLGRWGFRFFFVQLVLERVRDRADVFNRAIGAYFASKDFKVNRWKKYRYLRKFPLAATKNRRQFFKPRWRAFLFFWMLEYLFYLWPSMEGVFAWDENVSLGLNSPPPMAWRSPAPFYTDEEEDESDFFLEMQPYRFVKEFDWQLDAAQQQHVVANFHDSLLREQQQQQQQQSSSSQQRQRRAAAAAAAAAAAPTSLEQSVDEFRRRLDFDHDPTNVWTHVAFARPIVHRVPGSDGAGDRLVVENLDDVALRERVDDQVEQLLATLRRNEQRRQGNVDVHQSNANADANANANTSASSPTSSSSSSSSPYETFLSTQLAADARDVPSSDDVAARAHAASLDPVFGIPAPLRAQIAEGVVASQHHELLYMGHPAGARALARARARHAAGVPLSAAEATLLLNTDVVDDDMSVASELALRQAKAYTRFAQLKESAYTMPLAEQQRFELAVVTPQPTRQDALQSWWKMIRDAVP